MRSIFAALAVVTLFAAPAAAQAPQTFAPEQKAFASVNFGFEGLKQDVTQTAEFPLYDETATWTAPHAVKGTPTFDIGGGYYVRRNVAVGLAYTMRSKHQRDVTVSANVPSPIFTDALRTATGDARGLEHSEQAVHLQALWRVPVLVEFDVHVFGGPTFFRVKDELINTVSINEADGNFSSINVGDIGVSSQSHSSLGFNLGVDTRYMLMRNVGVGAMLRYSRGTVDLTNAPGTTPEKLTIDAGGLEIGAGLRFRF